MTKSTLRALTLPAALALLSGTPARGEPDAFVFLLTLNDRPACRETVAVLEDGWRATACAWRSRLAPSPAWPAT
jgi:hypothetical protein